MKRLFILSAALMFIAGIAAAQQVGDSTHKHGMGRMGMQRPGTHGRGRFDQHGYGFGGEKGLNLTDAQKQQLKGINADYHKQLAVLQANDKLSLGDYKARLADLQKNHQAKVQGVFTDEQKKQMAAFKSKREENLQVRGAAHVEKLKIELGLTDDQVAKIKTQQEQMRSKVKALHENSDLLPEQKREQMKTLFAQQKDQFKAVLTPDQATKLDSLQKHHFRRGGDAGRGGFQGRMAR